MKTYQKELLIRENLLQILIFRILRLKRVKKILGNLLSYYQSLQYLERLQFRHPFLFLIMKKIFLLYQGDQLNYRQLNRAKLVLEILEIYRH